MKSISAIYPAITENMENMLVKCAPQRLIIRTPISQYTQEDNQIYNNHHNFFLFKFE